MKALNLILVLFALSQACQAQLNVSLLHQLIADSQSEHDRQVKAAENQRLVSINESLNNSAMSKLKTTYGQLQERFSKIGGAIDALQIGIQASPLLQEIVQGQLAIIERCRQRPLLIPLASASQIELLERSQDLLSFLYGLSLSVGELSQMGQADRKLLFGFVITELAAINGRMQGLLANLDASSRALNGSFSGFPSFVDRDRALIENIIGNAKKLTH